MIIDALATFLPQRAMTDESYGPTDPFWYRPTGTMSASGMQVTQTKALGVSTAYGCVRILRESLGSLPWKTFRTTGNSSKEAARDHYLWKLLQKRPNKWMTAMNFVETAVTCLCMRGNFYCLIYGFGDETQLIPLSPDRMIVEQAGSGSLRYRYREEDGNEIVHPQENIFHVRGLSLDGINGLSVLEFARDAIGSSMAQETHGASLFKNGGLPTFWISRPQGKQWTPQARQNFRDDWKAVHAGAQNAGKPPILGEGMELRELGLTNRDSQWIESRGFSAEEICRFFGVPPYMLGVRSTSPQGSVEQQGQEFVNYTLGPMACRFEQAADRDLIVNDDYFTTIVLDGLLRGDTKSRYEAHNIAVQGGWMTVNEVRELEDRNPIEGGDTPRYPLNMQPAGGGPDQNEQGGQPGKGSPKTKPQESQEDDEPTSFEKRKKKKAEAFDSFSVLLADAASRIALAEIRGLESRIDKAADDPTRWVAWAETLYKEKHQAYLFSNLSPFCAAWVAMSEDTPDTAVVCNSVLSLNREMLDENTNHAALLDTWRKSRAAEIQTRLETIFFGDDKNE